MDVKITNSTLDLLLVLDSATRLEYTESLWDAGSLFLEVPYSQKYAIALEVGNRIVVEDLVYTIESSTVRNDAILVTGVGIFAEYEHLYVTQPRLGYATPNAYALELASALRVKGVYCTAYGITGDYDTIEVYDYGTSYASILKRLFFEHGFGYRMCYNSDKKHLEFHLCALADKAYSEETRVVVSDMRENYELVKVEDNISRYKNCVELALWFPVTQTLIKRTYDRSLDEPKRTICQTVSLVAETELELELAFRERAEKLFVEHRRKRTYTVRPTRRMGIALGDICKIESEATSKTENALFLERKVRALATGCEELYVFEVR